MLERIISWSIRRRGLVLALACGLAVVGAVAFVRLPLDAFPDTTPVQVHINTRAPALAPLDVERQITAQVEQAISGLPALREVRSLSRFGLSQVTAVFADGTDIQRARQTVTERLQEVELPAGIERPRLGPVATGLGEVFHYLVSGDGRSLAELRTVHDWVIRPQLRSVPGVAEVNAWGGDERQVQIVVDPAELASHGLTLPALIEAVERNNAAVGGGVIDAAGQSSLVQGIGLVTKPSDVGDIVVATRDAVPTHVHDVARVVEGRAIRHGAVTAGGRGEVVLGLGFMLLGENSHDVTRRLEARLAEVRKTLPAGIEAVPVYERTDLVDHVLETVRTNLLEGALLVVAVLFAFLGNLRAGLIVAAAIPLSMLFAFDLMLRAGIAGSLMSLGAIDFGLIVDSAVIQVENAARRLGEAAGTGAGDAAAPGAAGRSGIETVEAAAIEVRRPTMFGELIILIVYLPILALTGVEGKMFRPMALTVMFALLGSLLLSLTVIPALCATFLPGARPPRRNRLVDTLDRLYAPALEFALRRRGPVLAVAAVLIVAAVLVAPRLGSVFVPRLNEGAVVINCVRLAGVSLDESVRYGTRIERTLLAAFPDEIGRVWTRTGTAEIATDPMGVELSDVFVTLRHRSAWKRAKTQDQLVRGMEEALSGLPGMRTIFTQPIEMRLNEMVAGVRADVAVKIFGDDFETLRSRAREVEALMRSIPGAADVVTEQLTGQPVLQVEVDRAAIARHGIAVRDALEAVEALGGREVGTMQEGDRRFPIAVRLDERYRTDPAAVARIPVASEAGDRVVLGSLARIETVEGPSAIQREWGRRRIVVQGNVRGRDVGGFVEELRREIDRRVPLPAGYYIRYGGQFEHLERARQRLLLVVPLALALIAALLYLTFRSWRDAGLVFTAVPLAAVGGVLALWLRGLPFSISAAVGFIALCGVAVLNGLVLVSSIRQELAAGTPPREAIARAARLRLRPVLMTALVASLGFVPMALNTGIGAEVQRPLATVVIGGVLTSTLLTLFVLPVLVATCTRGSPSPPRR